MKIKLTQGAIHVEDVYAHYITNDIFILEANTRPKYPQLGPLSSRSFTLLAGPETLKAEDSKGMTVIEIEGLEANWYTDITSGRYSVTMFLYPAKEPGDYETLWRDNE